MEITTYCGLLEKLPLLVTGNKIWKYETLKYGKKEIWKSPHTVVCWKSFHYLSQVTTCRRPDHYCFSEPHFAAPTIYPSSICSIFSTRYLFYLKKNCSTNYLFHLHIFSTHYFFYLYMWYFYHQLFISSLCVVFSSTNYLFYLQRCILQYFLLPLLILFPQNTFLTPPPHEKNDRR